MSAESSSLPAPAPGKRPASDAPTDVEAVELRTDTRGPIRLGFWVLIVGFGLFLAWAAYAPLDEGVIAPSTVSTETRRKAIQHQTGGVIKKVLVQEGQEIQAGDALVVLDDAMTRAAFESVRQNYLGQRALESRLLAEIASAPRIEWHPDLQDRSDPVIAQHVNAQTQLYAARRAAQQAELAAANQAITGLNGQLAGLRRMLSSRTSQSEIQAQQLANVGALADDGFLPRSQLLQLQQASADLRSGIADLESNIHRTESAIAETRLRIALRQQENLKEVSAQLADVRREVQGNRERLAAITQELARTEIRSPVAGQVVSLSISGFGGVVGPGQRMMDIVPKDEALILEAKIPTNVIDRVAPGALTEVRFSSFANAPQLVVHGRVMTVSKDAVQEASPQPSHPYYLARVEVTAEGLKALGDHRMQPGMPAEVLVKTGERSLLTYLMHPLTKRVATAMTEE
jgi:protease secretion system membrane fusion protein